jgi:hypothetical protein
MKVIVNRIEKIDNNYKYNNFEYIDISRLANDLKSESIDKNRAFIFQKFFENKCFVTCKNTLLKSVWKYSSTICQGLLLRENLWFKKRDVENMEVRVFDWQRVKYCTNSIDLATILAQCDTNQWNDLIKIYVHTIQKKYPAAFDEELWNEMTNLDFIYALIILSFENNQLHQFSKILSFIVSE